MKKMQKIFISGGLEVHSEQEMMALGRRMAAALDGGEILGLVGNLGAGKTHLVQGILEGLGVEERGASPTFELVHEHREGRLPVAHFDFYRLQAPEEALHMGWDEYLSGGAVLLVEWADRFDGMLMPPDTQWIVLEYTGPSSRRVRLVEA